MNTDLELWYTIKNNIQKVCIQTREAIEATDESEVGGAIVQHFKNVRELLVAAMWYLDLIREAAIEEIDPDPVITD